MITFTLSVVLLLLGYLFYSKVIENLLDIDQNKLTPAYVFKDNVDYIALNKGKNMLINILNIAGTGPVFGPILAALYGPVAMLWIVFGCIFAGAVHDMMIGVISLKNKGSTLPTLANKYLFKGANHVVNAFSVLLLLLVGTVFVAGPANLVHNLFDSVTVKYAVFVIFAYYVIATLMPVDKIIGRFYPYFSAILIFSSISIFVGVILFSDLPRPELSLQNMHPANAPIFPLLFLVLSCGALSGFHATQVPIVARTLQSEKHSRQVFYGSMISEGVIALVWCYATIMAFDGATLAQLIQQGTPSLVVERLAVNYLGALAGTVAVIGVIILPITSGDTAFRSLRLMLSEYLKINQKPIVNRLLIAIPCFAISIVLTNMDFQILWRYFSWANQMLATTALWIATIYLIRNNKPMYYTFIPALFITFVVLTYILYNPIGFSLDLGLSKIIALGSTFAIALAIIFYVKPRILKSIKNSA